MELYEVTVQQGQDIKNVLRTFIQAQGWTAVIIIGAIGSVQSIEFNTPRDDSIPMNLANHGYAHAAEVVSFVGEVMTWEHTDKFLQQAYKDSNDALFIHIHASVATADGSVIGGGLVSGKAFRALRIFMTPEH
ncbi:MAG: PPC domain-containing DNA-binding protein [Pyramidobacter sp.]|uniref:PPC domain-containing DNA-binding protein n=1 Tax=Pyramidobacter sp. TaxID=1943581 RepID=UPI002A80654B|nr:PPC domain-containing DNA-binding protein [Pyramidobacter sp.]MDY4032700.1 PPC domain-containing DNA-binding protein [Pyramidobacter sp.]